MKNMPPKTRKLNETKGRAYMLLKKLSRAGKRRFASDPSIAANFSLDILNRKSSGRGKEDTPSATENNSQ